MLRHFKGKTVRENGLKDLGVNPSYLTQRMRQGGANWSEVELEMGRIVRTPKVVFREVI